jgi:hypothetical protein
MSGRPLHAHAIFSLLVSVGGPKREKYVSKIVKKGIGNYFQLEIVHKVACFVFFFILLPKNILKFPKN